jgi:hypothetical protein
MREGTSASCNAQWNSAVSNQGTVVSAHPAIRYVDGKQPGEGQAAARAGVAAE